MEEKHDIIRLWKPVSFAGSWSQCDTYTLDDIAQSWFNHRETLQNNSTEYAEFIEQLKRQHAIETGVIERLYDLKRGITETFIKAGFAQSYLSHGDTDIPEAELMNHLHDHLNSVNFIFDVVKEDRPLSVSFIKELHALVTRHQKDAEGRDAKGNKTRISLRKGQFKEWENNPVRSDGKKILYCPPLQVQGEMENLVSLYNQLVEEEQHPLILASWFHHAFTTIHPFQDGNGRVARLLASLIFIKFGYFPVNVLREEAKEEYIAALEQADQGNPQPFVSYFGKLQKRNIQRALNIKEVSSISLEQVQNVFVQKVENWKQSRREERQKMLQENRNQIFAQAQRITEELFENLKKQLNGNAKLQISICSFEDVNGQSQYFQQIVSYSQKHNYYFNPSKPRAWIELNIELAEEKKYQLVISLHHYGYDDATIAFGAFLEYNSTDSASGNIVLPLSITPHEISIENKLPEKEKNIRAFLENALSVSLAQIASEIG